MDDDLSTMTHDDLMLEVRRLRNGIRNHRDAKGHNLCWYVPELWNLLPERIELQPEAPLTDEFLRCCAEYRKSIG